MSYNNVISHPRFAAVPVKNPPMRRGPKPAGTSGFYAAQGKRDRERRLRERDQARQAEEFPGVRPEMISDAAVDCLINTVKLLDIPKLQRLVDEALRLVRERRGY